MARVKKTVKVVEGADVADSNSDAVVSFEFGLCEAEHLCLGV